MATNEKDKPGLAKPTWVSTAKDALAPVDVYTETITTAANKTVNTVESWRSNITATTESYIKQSQAQIDKVQNAKNFVLDSKAKIDKATGAARILASTDALKSGLKNLGIESEVVTNVTKLVETAQSGYQKVSDVRVQINGVEKKIHGQVEQVRKIIGQISAFLGSSKTAVYDLQTRIAVAASTIITAVNAGVHGTYLDIIKQFSGDDESIKKITVLVLPTVIKCSDLLTIKDICSTLGTGGILKLNPVIIRELAKAYSIPKTTDSYTTLAAEIYTVFDIIDPNWRTTSIKRTSLETVEYINAIPFAYGSADFKTIMISGCRIEDEDSRKILAVATLFQTEEVLTNLASAFPEVSPKSNVVAVTAS